MQVYITNICLVNKTKIDQLKVWYTYSSTYAIMIFTLLASTMFSYKDENFAFIDTEATTLTIHICLENIHRE